MVIVIINLIAEKDIKDYYLKNVRIEKNMKYIPLANLKNTTGIVAFCKEAKEIVVANRNGLPKLVLMSRDVY
ncbi:MAG: hypothetical protein IKT25_09750, partial [Firmicutes bacterium]|nr:hypothetical protein [Bacillota bacterium]